MNPAAKPGVVHLERDFEAGLLTHAPPSPAHLSGDPPAAAQVKVLPDRRELAVIAVERTRMPMVITDPSQHDNPIVLANQAFLDMIGYTADEVIGRNCRFLQGPETDPLAVDQVREAIADQRGITVELVNYRKDMSSFWNRLLLSPICDDDGKLQYYFGSQIDISVERRGRTLALDEHRLLREVDHRAKNALALVQGIVRLTRADDPAAYSRAVQGRVDALALAHSMLSEVHWRDVGLDRVIAKVVAPFGRSRVSAEGLPLMVAAAQVQPLVLLLHELMENAAQHGALSRPGGAMALRWHPEPERIVIALTETGGPPLSPQRTPGFGLTMVDAFVRRQLRGTVKFDWNEEGLRTRLTVPALPVEPAAADQEPRAAAS